MTDWLRVHLAPLPLTSYALTGLFLLAALEFLGWRQPIRDGLATGRAWLIAKALALRSLVAAFGREVRDFWRWVVNPAPIQASGTEDGEWIEFPIGTSTGSSNLDGWTVTYWPSDKPTPEQTTRRKPRPKPEDIAKKVTRKRKK